MSRVLLGVTGSVAAIRTPALFGELRSFGHEVRVVATEPSLYFFDPAELDRATADSVKVTSDGPLFRDCDEWPGPQYQRGDRVLHIEFRKWADILVISPLDANTLAKLALGISDNFLCCIFRAWDFTRPVILAPAMNTGMWNSPITLRHLRQLLDDRAVDHVPPGWTLDEAAAVFARYAPKIVLVPPQAKRLACGDVGLGAMAEVSAIAEVVRQWADQGYPLADA